MHYYQHHIGDFIRDTANLNDHQLATYLRMIWSYYDSEKPISGDLEDVAFAMRSDEKTVRLLLRHYFTETPEGWLHNRCEKEISNFHSKKEKAKASAKARWGDANASERIQTHEKGGLESSGNNQNYAEIMRSQCERNAKLPKSDANQEPITNNQEPLTKNQEPLTKNQEEKKASQPTCAVEPQASPSLNNTSRKFEEFWQAYPNTPRRTAKAKCLDRWKKMKLDAMADEVLDHVRAMAKTRQWMEGYEPAPLKYLGEKRWQDGVPLERISQPQPSSLQEENQRSMEIFKQRMREKMAAQAAEQGEVIENE